MSMAAALVSSRTSLPGAAGARTGRSRRRIGCSAFTRTRRPLYAAAHGSALQSVGHELVKQGGKS